MSLDVGRVAIVVVSHSPGLATAAVQLALEMVPQDPPTVLVAAGTPDGGIGTDAMAVSEAVVEAAVGSAGVLVLMDLGSAVMSAEMALEFADVDVPVRLTSAPFVEGLLAAVVSAAAGLSLEAVEHEALGALAAKSGHLTARDPAEPHPAEPHLSDPPPAEPYAAEPLPAEPQPAPDRVETPRDPGVSRHDRGSGGAGVTHAPVTVAPKSQYVVVGVANRDGLHARPAAQLVAAVGRHDAELTVENLTRSGDPVVVTGTTGLLALGGRQGDELRLGTTGPDAEALLAEVQALFADGFGESLEPAAPRRAARTTGPVGIGGGRAVGRVHLMAPPVAAPETEPRVPDGERAEATEAIGVATTSVAADLRRRAASAAGAAREILEATALLVTDPDVLGSTRQRVLADGLPGAAAVWEEFGARADQLRSHGGAFAERAADLDDARARIVAVLTDQPVPGLPDAEDPYVLVTRDLAPADTALLDPRTCLALVTEEGGPTSHTAIIARALGIPAVVAAQGVWSDPQGSTLLVDGSTGELVWDPDPDLVEEVRNAPATAVFTGRGITADGHHVPLQANVGSAAEASSAADAGAEGIGLFRTELGYLGREDAPGVQEQVAAYREVLAAFPGRRVAVRTLDAGSDKPLAFVTIPGEENPALGVRGYRTARAHPGLLEDQLRAIAQAADVESAEVEVMAPMISTVEEAAEFVDLARSHGLRRVGVMIETPSAALVADRLLEVVDFVSLGTNDLTQYVMAADRGVGALASLNDPWQPAVLELVGRVGGTGAASGKPVGVCGEAAADPLLAAVLVGLGVTSLSMGARAIPAVAELLAGVTLEQCRSAASAAARASSPADARAAARAALGD